LAKLYEEASGTLVARPSGKLAVRSPGPAFALGGCHRLAGLPVRCSALELPIAGPPLVLVMTSEHWN
jgi:hypothetical protein